MSDKEDTVECPTHGTASEAWVCQHLVGASEKLGFNVGYDVDDPDDYYPDAWCDECEKALETEGEWNETSQAFANIKLVCSGCYQDIRERNWKQDKDTWDTLVRDACSSMSKKQEKFLKDFRINDHGRWDRDQEAGNLSFSHEGEPQVTAKFHFAGSLSLSSNTWMWAWANEGFEESTRIASRRIRELGDEQGFLNLSAHLVDATEHDAGHFAAIMAQEFGAIGTYRTFDDDRWAYMIITDARWVNKKKFLQLFG